MYILYTHKKEIKKKIIFTNNPKTKQNSFIINTVKNEKPPK